MAHWAHLPVGLWNGHGWYDMHGIFTGSATIVGGSPVLVFPGVCDLYPPGSAGAAVPGCKYGYAFGTATPANRSDPLLQNWTSVGPIANDTFDDPSTAWQTPSGEWRLIGHCGDGTVGDCGPSAPRFQSAPLWASRDFRTWRRVGFTNLPAGECASLYPLPPLVNGTRLPPGAAETMTHVHKWGCGWTKDCYAIGSWVDGHDDSEPGVWTTAATSPEDGLLEHGIYYAAKDFWDGKHGRRIQWGWAPLYTNSLALPREVRYDPRLQQLVFSPLSEQALLRNGTLARKLGAPLRRGTPLRLRASNQAEAELIFELPAEAMSLVATLASPSGAEALRFQIDYAPPTAPAGSAPFYSVQVTGTSSAKPPSRHRRTPASPSPPTTARGGGDGGDWSFSSELRLLPSDEQLCMRLFFDHTIAEAYWQGRVAMTLPLASADWGGGNAELTLSANATASVASAEVWSVTAMWVAPEEALESREHATA
jgi:beta-fructofuranosidase